MKNQLINRLRVTFENGRLIAFTHAENFEEAECIATQSKQTCEISELCDKQLKEDGLNFSVRWYSTDAIDLLGDLDMNYYGGMLNSEASIIPTCNFLRSRPDAVPPSRAHTSDSGYDLVLLECVKAVGDVQFFTTGIRMEPPHGYYFDLVARSSISKTGYTLANCVGIIDQNYRGDIIVPLRKADKDMQDIELPCKLVQLIPRKWHTFSMIEVDELDTTAREHGGFGSTN